MIRSVIRWFPVSFVAVIVAMFSFVQSPLIRPNAGIDQQVFLLGAKLQTQGKLMYVDFFDHKGPVFHFMNYVGYAVTGNGWGVWMIESGIMLTSVIWCFVVLKKVMGRLCACLFCIGMMPVMMSSFNYPETFCVWYSLLALALALSGVEGVMPQLSFAMAGILGAMAFFSKQTCIGAFVAIAVLLLVLAWRNRNRRAWLFSYVSGGMLASALIVLILWIDGNLAAFYDCCFRFNLVYSRAVDCDLYDSLVKVFQREWVLFCMVGVVLCVMVLQNGAIKLFYFAWAAGFLWELFFLVRTGRLYDYQFHGLRMCLYLSFVPVVCSMCKSKMVKSRWLAVFGLLGLILVLHGPGFIRHAVVSVARLPRILRQGYSSQYSSIVKRIKTLPDSYLFVWGNTCDVFSLTGRHNPLPYYYWAPVGLKGYNDEPKANELVRRIEKSSPCIILDTAKTIGLDNESIFSVDVRDSDFKRLLRDYVTRTCVEVTNDDDTYHLYLPRDWK